MRGHVNPQAHMFSYFSPEERVPAKHPLRSIKAYTDSALKQIRPVLDGIYSQIGRPSIPPERLLKAQLPTFIRVSYTRKSRTGLYAAQAVASRSISFSNYLTCHQSVKYFLGCQQCAR
jgi:hypothetical protein